jgi:hypothetical protein
MRLRIGAGRIGAFLPVEIVMPPMDIKQLYTLHFVTDIQLHTLAELVFARISEQTGEDRAELRAQWLALSRKRFGEMLDVSAVMAGSTVATEEMRKIAQGIFDEADRLGRL